jgi:phosphoglycerate dehydrogenase-like enzyme
MVVHLPERPEEELAELLERLARPAEISYGPEPNPHAEVLIHGRPPADLLNAMPAIHSLVIPFAGVPAATRDAMLPHKDIQVYNLHHNAAPTAEKAIALMMAAAKGTVGLDQRLRKGDWSSRYASSTAVCLEGKQALVIGYGRIGHKIARACLGLGMNVDAIKRTARHGYDGEVSIYAPTGLGTLLPKADVVLLACPLTDETADMIGPEEIASMKQRSLLISIARGGVVDEEALYLALKENRIGGAGLDVWWQYPKSKKAAASTEPSRFPYGELENVVLSPHVGGACQETERLRIEHLAELIARLPDHAGDHRVDLHKGY